MLSTVSRDILNITCFPTLLYLFPSCFTVTTESLYKWTQCAKEQKGLGNIHCLHEIQSGVWVCRAPETGVCILDLHSKWGHWLWLWNKPDELECIQLGNYPPERLYPQPQPLLPLINYVDGTNFKCFQVIVARMLPELTCGSFHVVTRLHLEMKMLWQTARVFLALAGNSSFFSLLTWPCILTAFPVPPLPTVSRTVSTRWEGSSGPGSGDSGYQRPAALARPWVRLSPLGVLRVWAWSGPSINACWT